MIYEIIGTRPEAGRVNPYLQSQVIFTGQHKDKNMNHLADFNVQVKVDLAAQGFADTYAKLETLYQEAKPDLTIVHGDTNSALAGAMVSARYHVPVAHVEAGCRADDPKMIEEQNRKMITQLACYHFAPTVHCFENLRQENALGFGEFTGDVLYDLFLQKEYGFLPIADHILLTLHRAENVDDPNILQNVFDALQNELVIFPIHPRTKQTIKKFRLILPPKFRPTAPVTYAQMRCWEKSVRLIVTDSGGVQREAYWSQVPCVTVRHTTEWPETVKEGWNIVVGTTTSKIKEAVDLSTFGNLGVKHFGDGTAHKKIATILKGFE